METQLILKKTVTINAPVEKVWDALTNPELIKQYLFGTTAISDWKEGSSLLFTGTWDGKEYVDKGTILTFDRNKVFKYNYWSSFSGLPDVPENYAEITFTLEPVGSKTNLHLTQGNIANETSLEHSDNNWGEVLKKMNDILVK